MAMIKGLAYTTPIIGRISIGKMVESAGKRLPKKEDHFTITTQAQRAGEWIVHPLQDKLLKDMGVDKLTSIPVGLMYNNVDLNLSSNYSAFDKATGRQLCVGDGEKAKRVVGGKVESVECPGKQMCEFGMRNRCDYYARLHVQIDGQSDDESAFIFRTRGINSVRTLGAKLARLKGRYGRLVGLPLDLKLRGKSGRQSHGSAFFFVDLQIREGMTCNEAIALAIAREKRDLASDLNQVAFEEAALAGLQNGAFEETEEDAPEFEDLLAGEDEPRIPSDKEKIDKLVTFAEGTGLDALRHQIEEEAGGDQVSSGAPAEA